MKLWAEIRQDVDQGLAADLKTEQANQRAAPQSHRPENRFVQGSLLVPAPRRHLEGLPNVQIAHFPELPINASIPSHLSSLPYEETNYFSYGSEHR